MIKPTPSISIILPVHNEQDILFDQASSMIQLIREVGCSFELILVENGSTDRTLEICLDLGNLYPEVCIVKLSIGDYGIALKRGIQSASNDVIIIFNVEFWNTEFVDISLAALRSRTIVIGSKSAPGAFDERPFLRRLVTKSYNMMLRLIWGFDGTDTHGMKAFWRTPLLSVVEECKTTSWVFDTEFVIRAQRAGHSKIELPTDVQEIRAPSVGSLARRVPSVLRNLVILWINLSLVRNRSYSSPEISSIE